MGSLTLPARGPIYLDANGFIYSVERIEPYRTSLEPLWQHAQEGQFQIVSSELTLLETLVKPFQKGDALLENIFRSLFESREVQLIPVTTAIWEQAARLRASLNLKTPDALHAASALAAGSTLLLTNDPDFRRIPDVPVTVLGDLVS